jgi:hypothetical protein
VPATVNLSLPHSYFRPRHSDQIVLLQVLNVIEMQLLCYSADMYGGADYSEAAASQAYQQQQLYEQQQQQTLAGYDQTGQYDQPPTPVNMVTRVRVTRARVRAAAAAAAPPPLPSSGV